MVCYDSVLCDLCGDNVYNGELFGEPTNSSHGVRGAEQLPVSVAAPLVWWVLNEATVDSTLLDVLEQFEDQATDRLLLTTLEGCEDPPRHNTINEDKKTPAKMLPSTLCVLYVKMYNLHFCCK